MLRAVQYKATSLITKESNSESYNPVLTALNCRCSKLETKHSSTTAATTELPCLEKEGKKRHRNARLPLDNPLTDDVKGSIVPLQSMRVVSAACLKYYMPLLC